LISSHLLLTSVHVLGDSGKRENLEKSREYKRF